VGGTRELVDIGDNGYLFNPGDINLLTKYIRILLKDSALCRDMGVNGKRIIKTRFSTKKYAKDFENMVRDLVV